MPFYPLIISDVHALGMSMHVCVGGGMFNCICKLYSMFAHVVELTGTVSYSQRSSITRYNHRYKFAAFENQLYPDKYDTDHIHAKLRNMQCL